MESSLEKMRQICSVLGHEWMTAEGDLMIEVYCRFCDLTYEGQMVAGFTDYYEIIRLSWLNKQSVPISPKNMDPAGRRLLDERLEMKFGRGK